MRKISVYPVLFCLLLFLYGCSSGNDNNVGTTSDSAKGQDTASPSIGMSKDESIKKESKPLEMTSQKVIYVADLQLHVKNFEKSVRYIEQQVKKLGGYIVQSNITREGKEQLNGNLIIRIPQDHFQQFLNDAEKNAVEVMNRNVSGQDVTEEYVDLDSRLKSKRVVEARLIGFMKSATKTEDLLKISENLGKVQENIEKIEGRIKYLNNQIDFATVTITLNEKKVVVPDIEKKQNVWERTMKQFISSLNFLLAAFSGIFVFLVGNLPIFAVILLAGVIIWFIRKQLLIRKNSE